MARGCILTVLLMLAGSGMCQAVAQTIPDGYVQVARAHGIPAEVLYAVSLTETAMAPGDVAGVMQYSRCDGRLPDVSRPWPWTINVAGKGYRYASRLEAWQALQMFLKRYPAKRIDVGIAQVNLGWNGHRFPSTWAAFDPYTSLETAAVVLQECHQRYPDSWLKAAGCYHHPAGGKPAARYIAVVRRHLDRLHVRSATTGMTSRQTAMLTSSPRYIWTEPQEKQK